MKIGLALGGGGARGLAHIGVLKALEEHDLEPVAVAGTSMGGIVGALYCAGYSAPELHEAFEGLSFWQLLDIGRMGAFMGGRGIERTLKDYLPARFEDLGKPLELTAVDLQEGKLIILREGELIPALRATSAIPGLLSPAEIGGRLYVDGGLLNNLPVDVIRTMTLAPVVAVDVAPPPNRTIDFENAGFDLRDPLKRSLNTELFLKAFDIPQKVLTSMRLSMQPPELLIRPALDPMFGIEEFSRLEEAIEAGYSATSAALGGWSVLGTQAS